MSVEERLEHLEHQVRWMRRAILNTAAVGLVLGCVALGGVALLGIRSARADEGLVTTRVLVALAGVGIIALVIGLLFLWSVRRSPAGGWRCQSARLG